MAEFLGPIANAHTYTSSGAKDANAVISAVPCRLVGVGLFGDGTNAVTAILYDHPSTTSGTVVYKGYCIGTDGHTDILPLDGIQCWQGLYLKITQAGTSGCVVYYA